MCGRWIEEKKKNYKGRISFEIILWIISCFLCGVVRFKRSFNIDTMFWFLLQESVQESRWHLWRLLLNECKSFFYPTGPTTLLYLTFIQLHPDNLVTWKKYFFEGKKKGIFFFACVCNHFIHLSGMETPSFVIQIKSCINWNTIYYKA